MKTTLSVTFNCLTPCSNLVNCFNHRELIPVMPLPPLLRVVSGRCIVPLALIHPEYQPSPTIFRSPDPSSYLSASTLKIGQSSVCAHALAPTLWQLYFHSHKWCKKAKLFKTMANRCAFLVIYAYIYLHLCYCWVFYKHLSIFIFFWIR